MLVCCCDYIDLCTAAQTVRSLGKLLMLCLDSSGCDPDVDVKMFTFLSLLSGKKEKCGCSKQQDLNK